MHSHEVVPDTPSTETDSSIEMQTVRMEIETSKTVTADSKEDLDKVNISGVLIGILGELCYSFGPPLIKIIILHNTNMSTFEILYWKSLTMMGLNYCYCRYNGVFPMDVPTHFRNLIVFRALIGYTGIQGNWASIQYMRISTA